MKNKLILIAIIIITPVLILNFHYPSENYSKQTNLQPSITIIPENRFLFGALQPVIDDGQNFTHVNDLGLNMRHSLNAYFNIKLF